MSGDSEEAPSGVGVEPSISIQIEGGVGDDEHGAWHRGGDGVRRRRLRAREGATASGAGRAPDPDGEEKGIGGLSISRGVGASE